MRNNHDSNNASTPSSGSPEVKPHTVNDMHTAVRATLTECAGEPPRMALAGLTAPRHQEPITIRYPDTVFKTNVANMLLSSNA